MEYKEVQKIAKDTNEDWKKDVHMEKQLHKEIM